MVERTELVGEHTELACDIHQRSGEQARHVVHQEVLRRQVQLIQMDRQVQVQGRGKDHRRLDPGIQVRMGVQLAQPEVLHEQKVLRDQ